MTQVAVSASLPLLVLGALCRYSDALGLWSLRHAAWAGVPLWVAAALALGFAVGAQSPLFLAFASSSARATAALRERVIAKCSVGVIWSVALAFLSLGGFLLVRQRLFLPPPEGLGDSLDLARRIPVFTDLFGYLDSFDETLTLYLRSRLYAWLRPFGATAPEAGALWSSLWGAGFVFFVVNHMRKRPWREALLGVGLLLGTPSIQVFCGYVENYAEPMFFLCVLLVWGGHLLDGEPGTDGLPMPQLIGIAATAALASMFHLAMGMILPALAYLVYVRSLSRRTFVQQSVTAGVAALGVIVPVWVFFLMLHPHPVSLLDSHVRNPPIYPFREWFGAKHVMDQFNLWLLCAPGALVLLPLAVLAGKKGFASETRAASAPRVQVFYAVAAAGFIVAMFTVHPLLGFPADWDLLSFFCLPVHFLILTWLRPFLRSERSGPRVMLPILGAIFAGFLLTSAWIGRNMQSSAESERNLADAEEQAAGFLSELKADAVFRAIPAVRQKQYAKITLFAFRARRELAGTGTEEARLLGRRLELAVAGYRRIAAAPDTEYRAELPAVWRELTAVNNALAAIDAGPRH